MESTRLRIVLTVDLKRAGQQLREAREGLNLSIRALAKQSGVSPTHIGRMEAGRDFTVTMLARVSPALGIAPSALLEGSLEMNPGISVSIYYTEILRDDELGRMVASAPEGQFPPTLLDILGLTETLTACVCRLLLSSDPVNTLRAMALPLPILRRKLAGLLRDFTPETSSIERAVIFRALAKNPFAKLRSLGLLTVEVAEEYGKQRQEERRKVQHNLTNETPGSSGETVPNSSSAWERLVKRTHDVTRARGSQARLARDLNVTKQAVNNWLSGANAPAADVTLRLLDWVTAEEASQESQDQT